MKTAARFVIFMFLFYLATPTLVTVIKKTTDTSCFFSMNEEEHAHKELKVEFLFNQPLQLPGFAAEDPRGVLSANFSLHDNVAASIFLPPPELA